MGRGFGFIRPDSGAADVFCHISQLQRSGFLEPRVDCEEDFRGVRLEFESEPNPGKPGCLWAVRPRRVEADPAGAAAAPPPEESSNRWGPHHAVPPSRGAHSLHSLRQDAHHPRHPRGPDGGKCVKLRADWDWYLAGKPNADPHCALPLQPSPEALTVTIPAPAAPVPAPVPVPGRPGPGPRRSRAAARAPPPSPPARRKSTRAAEPRPRQGGGGIKSRCVLGQRAGGRASSARAADLHAQAAAPADVRSRCMDRALPPKEALVFLLFRGSSGPSSSHSASY